MSNRLSHEISPYLRQHRDNPVDWFPWGDEAFALARVTGKPILLSVGYSACHWCHVMAHECFEDVETASLMNELFVNIKVDREERPDVDAIYMDAVQAMTGRGGWPMTVFLTPDAKPFYGGTYFPKPTFIQLMNAIIDAWHNRRDDIEINVEALMQSLSRTSRITSNSGDTESAQSALIGPEHLNAAVEQMRQTFDAEWGGFGSAPKFPSTMNLDLLLRVYLDNPNAEILQILTTSLDAMASGGMYDHLGGGFARYSVDAQWLVPHFEKMLYDQALLARVYLHAGVALNEPRWLQIASETIDYVLRELSHPGGGFFCAQDADSADEQGHMVEGHFYVWSRQQVVDTLPQDLHEVALEWYEVTEAGNFEGTNILSRLHHRGDLKRNSQVERARALLLESRNTRPWPGLDDKVLTEWNGMMLATLAEAAALLQRPDWLAAAVKNGEFLINQLCTESGTTTIKRSWHQDGNPQAQHAALGADLAQLVDGFTRLAEATGKASWITHAKTIANKLLSDYWDAENSGIFTTSHTGEQLIVRQKDLMDNATPSANSTAAFALYRLAALTGEERYVQHADQISQLLSHIATSAPTAFGNLLSAAHLRHRGVVEVAITGNRPDLVVQLHAQWLPTVVSAWGERYDSPIWHDRNDDLAYVCRQYACMAPTNDAKTFDEALRVALQPDRG
ncbi:MAG: thioredoxin domain-containing protein [Actinobacteria bacterium]|nr:thioredoxin domain-containing protein [Actinomycetota bacterium]